jgi:hypothetical protein
VASIVCFVVQYTHVRYTPPPSDSSPNSTIFLQSRPQPSDGGIPIRKLSGSSSSSLLVRQHQDYADAQPDRRNGMASLHSGGGGPRHQRSELQKRPSTPVRTLQPKLGAREQPASRPSSRPTTPTAAAAVRNVPPPPDSARAQAKVTKKAAVRAAVTEVFEQAGGGSKSSRIPSNAAASSRKPPLASATPRATAKANVNLVMDTLRSAVAGRSGDAAADIKRSFVVRCPWPFCDPPSQALADACASPRRLQL